MGELKEESTLSGEGDIYDRNRVQEQLLLPAQTRALSFLAAKAKRQRREGPT